VHRRHWMRIFVFALVLAAIGAAASAQSQPGLVDIATRYVAAQEAVMQKATTMHDVDALLAFYAPGYTYYHPQFGAKVTGLDAVRNGITSHLGETTDARIEIRGILTNGDMVSLALRESFTDPATGKRIERDRTTVLTIKDGKVVQRVDM
jgi:ketosteroid isomerase-like protein